MKSQLSNAEIRFFLKSFWLLMAVLTIVFGVFAKWKELFDYLSYAFPIAAGVTAGAGFVTAKDSTVDAADDDLSNQSSHDNQPNAFTDKLMRPLQDLFVVAEHRIVGLTQRMLPGIDERFAKHEWWQDLKQVMSPESWADRWYYSASVFMLALGIFFYCMSHGCRSVTVISSCIVSAIACLAVLRNRVYHISRLKDEETLRHVVNVLTAIVGLLLGFIIFYGHDFFVAGRCVD